MNIIRTTLLAAALALTAGSAFAAEVAYTLDPSHTQVDFRWNHMGYSNPAASIDKVEGTLHWDAAAPQKSSVVVTMPLSSIRTRVPALDEHFQGKEYFNTAEFPVATFKSTKVERVGKGNNFRITGDLTLRGVTKPVVLNATLNGSGVHPMIKAPVIGFDATGSIKRSEFGMGVAVPMVSDRIDLRITTEAVEAKGFAAAMKAMEQQSQKK